MKISPIWKSNQESIKKGETGSDIQSQSFWNLFVIKSYTNSNNKITLQSNKQS